MKLIVIHGPPAAGKHTIGQELAGATGYKFFHNHLTVDVVRSLFDDEDERRLNLLLRLRVDTIAEAAHHDLDTIFTMAYSDDQPSRQFVKDMTEAVSRYEGVIHYVRLDPPDATLFERIGNESRRRLGKPTEPSQLRHYITTRQTRVTIDPATLVLDTSKLTPEESVRRIIDEFGLL
ncbi:MAG TPA: AAA family ATPase [Candidatus Saccharimonadales bacterium]|nr:AAA family ATPase [Candidatus Saccharimonadales bacterium]